MKAGSILDQVQTLVNSPSAVKPEGIVEVEKGATLDLSQYGADDKFQLGGTINVSGTLNVGEREVTGYPADFPKETGAVTYGTINFGGTLDVDDEATETYKDMVDNKPVYKFSTSGNLVGGGNIDENINVVGDRNLAEYKDIVLSPDNFILLTKPKDSLDKGDVYIKHKTIDETTQWGDVDMTFKADFGSMVPEGGSEEVADIIISNSVVGLSGDCSNYSGTVKLGENCIVAITPEDNEAPYDCPNVTATGKSYFDLGADTVVLQSGKTIDMRGGGHFVVDPNVTFTISGGAQVIC